MNDYNFFRVRSGNYDWLHQNEIQTQYIFYLRDDAPFDGKSFGVVLSNLAEEDFDTVYDCAVAVLEATERYILHPDTEKMKILVSYLRGYLYEDKIASLLDERKRLVLSIEAIDKRIAYVEREMEFERENPSHD